MHRVLRSSNNIQGEKISLNMLFFRECTRKRVKIGWCPVASYGEVTVAGYKIYVNNRLKATLDNTQLTYTLTNYAPCNIYTVHVQALSNDKNIVSPMSRAIEFAWPGVKPGAFRRRDDGQTGVVTVVWEPPQLEGENEELRGFKV